VSRADVPAGLSEGSGGQFAPAGSGVWYCKRRQLLRELPPRTGRRLRERARVRRFQMRDLLFGSEASGGAVHLVVQGRVRLARFDTDGIETQLAVIEPGEAFREPAHGEVEPMGVYAEALASGEMLSLELDELAEFVARDPESLSVLAGALE
jgi:CRP-like cAMP-binding protein